MYKKKYILLWCGMAKASGMLLSALGHLWQDFCLIPKMIEKWKRQLI